jgi:hypothetical protein
MTQPNTARAAFAKLLDAIAKGDAPLVTLDGKPASLPEHHRRQLHVVAHPFTGVDAIERANIAAGYHWFEPESMRFFGTKILRHFGSGVFVTHETDPMGRGAWSIRVASPDGNVTTFGEFNAIPNSRTATTMAKRLATLLDEGRAVLDDRGQVFTLDA